MTVLGGVTPVGALLACVGTWRAQTAPPILPTNGFFALDLASLSLAPVDCAGCGLVQTGKDVHLVLACFLLACFLLSERDNPDFAKAFEHGILPWHEKEQPKYNPWPPTKILWKAWKETIKWLPIIEAGLARAQRTPPCG